MKTINNLTILSLIAVMSFTFVAFTKMVNSTPYTFGDEIEDFTLPNTQGEQISLSDFSEEKGVILIFTCNTCPYAVAYENRINELHEKYAPMGYPVLAVNPNDPAVQPGDSMEEMKKRKKEKAFQFNYLLDVGQQVYPKFGATKTPHVFLLQNKEAKSYLKYVGAIDDNYKDASEVKEKFLENAIESLKKNEPIKNQETKAIGCTIKVAN